MTEEIVDHPPEYLYQIEGEAGTRALSLEEAAAQVDIGAQPDPEAEDFALAIAPRARRVSKSEVTWPDSDENCPDYSFVAHLPEEAEFELSLDTFESLFRSGRYEPYRGNGAIAFALRGARLADGHEAEEVGSVRIKNLRPDHRNFRCVIGFYFPDRGMLNAYTGSTVPCRAAIAGYANGGDACNMLPTGMHTFYVWRHRNLRPALRMGRSANDPETGADATVLRSRHDGRMDTLDIFDLSRPLDNVHCSYYLAEQAHLGATFSSWGCLTVRGRKAPSDQWEKFQDVLDGLGARQRVDLLLTTGKEAALAADGIHEDKLTALRFGSRGDAVLRLQRHLGLPETGYLGAVTLDKMTGAERALNNAIGNGKRATGVYTPELDASTGWQIFD